MVNQENLARCLTALRSGKYQQGTGRLRTDEGWCCLGVMTEEYRLATGEGGWHRNDLAGRWEFKAGSEPYGESATLPQAVQEWLGFEHANPEFSKTARIDATRSTLAAAGWNDHGKTFTEIADQFEKDYGPEPGR